MAKHRTSGKVKPAARAVPRRKAVPPMDAATLNHASYALICEMEDAVTAASDFADAVAYIAQTLGEQDVGGVVQRLAWTIKTHIESIEELRGKLFRFLHPRRADIEKTGWPSDAKVAS
jgi:hypothetical protein